MSRTNTLTQGPVLPALLKFTIPILCALILQAAYGTVDLWTVSHFGEIGDISGVNIGSQVTTIIINTCAGLAVGTTVLLGTYIGGKQVEKASRTIGVSIAVFAVLAVLITAGMLLFLDQIVTATQTPVEAVEQARSYLRISATGTVFIVAYNLLGSIFRGLGDSKTPLIAVGIACVINIVLDLLFVAVLDMGAAGAALATVIAQALSVFFALLIIRKRPLPFVFEKKYISLDITYSKEVIRLGVPVAFQSALSSISFLVVTATINSFGVYASSAVGVVSKINGIVMLVPISLMQSLAAFTAQNRGAGQMNRAKQGVFSAMGLGLIFGLVVGYVSWFHGEIFTGIFTSDPLLTANATEYLRVYAIETVITTVLFSFIGYFNGCGRTTFVMLQSGLSAALIRIPFTILFSRIPGTTLFMVGLGIPISTCCQIVVCVLYYRWYEGYLKKQQPRII